MEETIIKSECAIEGVIAVLESVIADKPDERLNACVAALEAVVRRLGDCE